MTLDSLNDLDDLDGVTTCNYKTLSKKVAPATENTFLAGLQTHEDWTHCAKKAIQSGKLFFHNLST